MSDLVQEATGIDVMAYERGQQGEHEGLPRGPEGGLEAAKAAAVAMLHERSPLLFPILKNLAGVRWCVTALLGCTAACADAQLCSLAGVHCCKITA
eukprot:1161955-Pelagomonas_calceolata.AAC.6